MSNSKNENNFGSKSAIHQKSEKCMKLLSRLREIQVDKYIDSGSISQKLVPEIVIIGAQSSGKSSVIESLCHIKLPKGIGTVTRCPLRLEMFNTTEKIWRAKLIYSGKSGIVTENIKDTFDAEQKIERAQREIIGNKKFSKEEITVKIESNKVSNLVIVDLPGLIYNTTNVELKENSRIVRDMVTHYMENPNAIVLIAYPANTDIANNEAFQLTQELQSKYFVVVTMPDKVHREERNEKLQKWSKQINDQYVLVRCPNEEEQKNNITWEEVGKAEKKLFANYLPSKFKKLTDDKWGIQTLSEKLSSLLSLQLIAQVENIRDMVKKSQFQYKEQLFTLEGRKGRIKSMISDLKSELEEHLKGRTRVVENNTFVHLLNIFNKNYIEPLDDSLDDFEEQISVENLCSLISKFRGIEPAGFLNPALFEQFTSCYYNSITSITNDVIAQSEKIVLETLTNIIDCVMEKDPLAKQTIQDLFRKKYDEIVKSLRLELESTNKIEEICYSEDFQIEEMIKDIVNEDHEDDDKNENEDKDEDKEDEEEEDKTLSKDAKRAIKNIKKNREENADDPGLEYSGKTAFSRPTESRDIDCARHLNLSITAYVTKKNIEMKDNLFLLINEFLLNRLHEEVMEVIRVESICVDDTDKIKAFNEMIYQLNQAKSELDRFITNSF